MEPPETRPLRAVVLSSEPRTAAYLRQVFDRRGYEFAAFLMPMKALREQVNVAALEVWSQAGVGVDTVVVTTPDSLTRYLQQLAPDLGVCLGFPWRVPTASLETARLGFINGHSSALPRWRGPNPLAWSIRAGDPEGGFSFHRMDADFDTGPLLASGTFPIDELEELPAIHQKLVGCALSLIDTALDRLERGDPGDAQDDALSLPAPLFPAEEHLDWSRGARELHNLVRSRHPNGALGEVGGRSLRIKSTRPADATSTDHPPGEIIACEPDDFRVQCGVGSLQLVDYSEG